MSYQIANFKAELGTRLFSRSSRSVELSKAAKALLPHALAVLQRIEEARARVQRVGRRMEGRVKLGLAGSHFLGPFPQFIKQFRERRPSLEVVLHEMRPADPVQALRDSRLDLSISCGALADGELVADLLWRDPLVAVVPPGHRLGGRARLRGAELKGEDFVFLRLDFSAFAQRVFDACVKSGFAPLIVKPEVEIPAVMNLLAAGLGFRWCRPRWHTCARTRSWSAVCRLGRGLQADGVSADVYLLRRSGEQPPAVLEFAEALRQWSCAQAA